VAKIVALQGQSGQLAALLRHHGYQVVDIYTAQQQRLAIDAILYTSYHPDITNPYTASADIADISFGSYITSEHQPLMLNITGQPAEQVINTLSQRLVPYN
jgi:hypothetical protein